MAILAGLICAGRQMTPGGIAPLMGKNEQPLSARDFDFFNLSPDDRVPEEEKEATVEHLLALLKGKPGKGKGARS